MEPQKSTHQRIKLSEINSYLMCQLCKGYLIDATTISECLHSFCRSCIINFLQDNSHCPVCEVLINKAKPNLKLDKTLQDVVYKLVPELFLKEMSHRQAFYQRHPDQAARVSPEQRGEDTERTIFNPRDTFSLSIEYISDESTPGAILLPSSKPNIQAGHKNGKNGLPKLTDSSMKRYLQCPGMCRVDVLKKFVRNKYNVNTHFFQIDVLYKRVPLPDHYTLIDIAYIYSWKRNEPMKFFFRITDIKLVKERFDYLEPQVKLEPPVQQQPTIIADKPKATKAANRTTSAVQDAKVKRKVVSASQDEIKVEIKNGMNGKHPVYTNITLNRSNNVEIITKIQKVSNKNGQPIGLNIIKQTVKKPNRAKVEPKVINEGKVVIKDEAKTSDIAVKSEVKAEVNTVVKTEVKTVVLKKEDKVKCYEPVKNEVIKTEMNVFDFDDEKERFLKSIELTSKSVVHTIAKSQKSEAVKAEALKFLALKRKSSPHKHEKVAKKPKLAVKKTKAPSKKLTKLSTHKNVPKKIDVPKSSENLKSLLNTCKIPSSLSITCVNGDHETHMKPVINHIEILKIPETSPKHEPMIDEQKQKLELEKVGTTMQATTKTDDTKASETEVNNKPEISISLSSDSKAEVAPRTLGLHPNLPKLPQPQSSGAVMKLNARSAQTFQKMFEEAIKKPEYIQPVVRKPDATAANNHSSGKRNILEIASQLQYKKTKLEQERNNLSNAKIVQPLNTNWEGKVAIPRLSNPKQTVAKTKSAKTDVSKDLSPNSVKKFQQTIANLHSASLGLNYTVSVNQMDTDEPKVKPINLGSSPRPTISYPRPNSQSPSLGTRLSSPGLPEITLSPKPRPNQAQSLGSPKNDSVKMDIPSNTAKNALCSSMENPKNLSNPMASPKSVLTPLASPNQTPKSVSNPLASPNQTPKSISNPLASPNQMPKTISNAFNSMTSPTHMSKSISSVPTSMGSPNKLPTSLASPNQFSRSISNVPNSMGSPNQTPKRIASPHKAPKPIPAAKHSPNNGLGTPRVAHKAANAPKGLGCPRDVLVSLKDMLASHREARKESPKTAHQQPRLASPPGSPKPSSSSSASSALDPNQLLEKYNIQNLAQLTASFNFNAANMSPANQIAAFQQAMILKHFEMQNRQNWLSMNSNPLVQYEKYLQSLNPNHLLPNIKEN